MKVRIHDVVEIAGTNDTKYVVVSVDSPFKGKTRIKVKEYNSNFGIKRALDTYYEYITHNYGQADLEILAGFKLGSWIYPMYDKIQSNGIVFRGTDVFVVKEFKGIRRGRVLMRIENTATHIQFIAYADSFRKLSYSDEIIEEAAYDDYDIF